MPPCVVKEYTITADADKPSRRSGVRRSGEGRASGSRSSGREVAGQVVERQRPSSSGSQASGLANITTPENRIATPSFRTGSTVSSQACTSSWGLPRTQPIREVGAEPEPSGLVYRDERIRRRAASQRERAGGEDRPPALGEGGNGPTRAPSPRGYIRDGRACPSGAPGP